MDKTNFVIKGVESVSISGGREFKVIKVQDENGFNDKLNVWPDCSQYGNIEMGATVSGYILVKGKYRNLVDNPVSSAPGLSLAAKRTNTFTAVKESQDRKEKSIRMSQDRNELMWASRSACELVAHHPAFKNLTASEVEQKIKQLRDLINSTPDEEIPF